MRSAGVSEGQSEVNYLTLNLLRHISCVMPIFKVILNFEFLRSVKGETI